MATKSLSPSGVLRFGVFQANLAARELCKHGVRVRLPGQPFCILSLLLERPGEVVTREEIRQRLWASDTFVDFEHSLNTAVKKLRAALGDSPERTCSSFLLFNRLSLKFSGTAGIRLFPYRPLFFRTEQFAADCLVAGLGGPLRA